MTWPAQSRLVSQREWVGTDQITLHEELREWYKCPDFLIPIARASGLYGNMLRLYKNAIAYRQAFEHDFTSQIPKFGYLTTIVDQLSSRAPLWLPEDLDRGRTLARAQAQKFMHQVYISLDKLSPGSKVILLVCGLDGWTTNPSRLLELMLRYKHLTIQLVFRLAPVTKLASAVREPSGILYSHVPLKDVTRGQKG